MKKLLKIVVVLTVNLILSVLILPVVANAQSNYVVDYERENNYALNNQNGENIVNQEALGVYNKLQNDTTLFSLKSGVNRELDTNEFSEGFEELSFISNNEKNLDVIYSYSDGKVATIINYDTKTELYNLVEANTDSGEVIILFNNEEYRIIEENENISIINSNNDIQPIVRTTYLDEPEVYPEFIELNENIIASHTFGSEYGPYTKTNTAWITVLGIISAVTGGINYLVNHPVLGAVSYISGTVATIGGIFVTTFYIRYWQAYSNQDPTYVRERQRWYEHSNHTGFKKQRYSYFYSQRPYNNIRGIEHGE